MPLLKVGKNHLFTEDIRNVITPSTDGGRDCVWVQYRNGNKDPFFGEEAETLRQWLASQEQSTHESELAKLRTTPAKPAIVTKAEPAKATK